MMAKGDLWKRKPGVIYACDFTNHSVTYTVHGPVNGWHILEVVRVYSRDIYPDHERTEHLFHVGLKRQRTGAFLRMMSFSNLDVAKNYAVMTGRLPMEGVDGSAKPLRPPQDTKAAR